ncbi:MAG: hypothetical protein JSW40_08610, partial [Candidatus Omnitrophota bacterium]
MKKTHYITLIFLAFIFLLNFSVYSGEELTLTTYYPAPYGVYKELRAQRMAIGNNYYDSQNYKWGNNDGDISNSVDLTVEGHVAIGTERVWPTHKLSIRDDSSVNSAGQKVTTVSIYNPREDSYSGLFLQTVEK